MRSEYRPAIERLSRDALVATQWQRLQHHLADVYRRNAFYGRVFERAGLRPDDIRTPADYRRLPVTTKQDVLDDLVAHPPYGSRLQVPRRRIVGVVETSGTTGIGQEAYPMTWRDRSAYYDKLAFGLFWAGVRPGSVVALTIPVTTTAAGQWYFGSLVRLRSHLLPLGNYDARRKIAYLQRYGCDALIASATYLRRLTAVAEEVGWQPRARSLVVAGESYSLAWARRMEELWGARLFEQYGATQRVSAWSCQRGALPDGHRGVLHLLEHIVYCEVLDRGSGAPVGQGEEGELVITPLQADASPLLRFATGDRVRWLPPDACPCGRPFAGIEAGTVARYDNMLKIKLVNVWPDAVDAVVLSPPEVLEYQGELRIDRATGREEAVIHVEYRPETPAQRRAALCAALEADLHERVGVRFTVGEHGGPSLVRGMRDDFVKRQRWTDRRGAET